MFHLPIKGWYITIIFGILAICSIVLATIFYLDGNARVQLAYEEKSYMSDRRAIDKILSEADKYLKITSFYSTIIGRYGKKYHPNYKDKINEQGLTGREKADVIREIYELERMLSIPHFTLISKAKIESGFAPKASTFTATGDVLEAGLWQNRDVAVMQASFFLRQMPPQMAERCAFRYQSIEDLYDPINACRIEAINTWGCMQRYEYDPSWVIPAVHWGITRIDKYWRLGIVPPKEFIFNKDTIKEDSRNPLTYYYLWNENFQQFSRFDIHVNVDAGWEKAYRSECSRAERDFIDQSKFVKEAKELLEEIKIHKLEVNAEYEAKNAKVDKLIHEANIQYMKSMGMIKTGRHKNIEYVFDIYKVHFMDMIREMRKPEVDRMREMAIFGYLVVLCLLLIFSVFGVISVFKGGIHLIVSLKKDTLPRLRAKGHAWKRTIFGSHSKEHTTKKGTNNE